MSDMHSNSILRTDVVICGGGMAGLTLARQLRMSLPDIRVIVLEKGQGPLPAAAFKVGESLSEIGAYYLKNVIRLKDYLRRRHVRKLGLRYFLGSGRQPLENRPELGTGLFPPLPGFQVDRGVFEADLRTIVRDMGVELYEGARIGDATVGKDGEPHEVTATWNGTSLRIQARWLVDATGRRCLLQRKLNQLVRKNGHDGSAAWFRVPGRVCVEALVPREHARWHRRTSESRWYATNHLMGPGYWIWMIPLASENTSIGIVTDETVHPYASYAHSYDDTVAWLSEHEPELARLIAGLEPLDFKRIRDFSYSSCRVFSSDRWSCVGEAAVFLDPFYSPGGDYIAVGNTITTELMRLDREGRFDRETADLYNDLFLQTMFPPALEIFRGSYITFGYPQIYTTKLMWDATIYWGAGPAQLFFQGMLRDPQSVREYVAVARRISALQLRIQQLFRDWAMKGSPRANYDYYDLSLAPFLQLVFLDLMVRKNKERFLNDLRLNLDRLDEAAQVLFRQAVGETMPEQLERLQGRWVNAWAISLNPDNWEADGLFLPESEPRDLTVMQHALFPNLFGPLPPFAQWRADVLAFCMHFWRGRPFYAFQEFIRLFLSLHSRMIYRRFFIKDQRAEPRTRCNVLQPAKSASTDQSCS